MSPRPIRSALALLLVLASGRVHAQDFASASPCGPSPGACAMLEQALPMALPHADAEAICAAWALAPSLASRAGALGVPVRAARLAIGVAQCGDPELGWSTCACAIGAADADAGAALRMAVRRDRAVEGATGLEAGGGAWLAVRRGWCAWASAPQCVTRGLAPPLARPLEFGTRAQSRTMAAWLALQAPGRGGDGERVLGVEWRARMCSVWAEGRDAPWRAACGVRARVRALVCAWRVDSHPWLGERVTTQLAWSPGGTRP